MEYWKVIKGGFKSDRYGIYWVSSLGRFKNGKGRILTFHPHKKGYLMVSLWRDGKEGRHQTHRLVAKAFIPNPNQLPQVNHLDGDKKNNRVSNLKWCSNLENMKHSWENGLHKKGIFLGEKSSLAHLTDEQAEEIRKAPLRKGPYAILTRKALAEMYGVTEHVIKDVRRGKSYRV